MRWGSPVVLPVFSGRFPPRVAVSPGPALSRGFSGGSGVLEKRVGRFLDADPRGGAVSGENRGFVWKCEQLGSDSGEEEVAVPSGQVPAADAAREEDIASENEVVFWEMKAEAAGAVARDFQDVEIEVLEGDGRGGFEGEPGLDGIDVPGEAEPAEELGVGDHGEGVWVVGDAAAVLALDFGGVPDVVDVAVGEQEQVDLVVLAVQP